MTATADDKLVDNHGVCSSWAEQGECDNNPGYMRTYCQASCAKYDKEIVNDNSFYDLEADDIELLTCPNESEVFKLFLTTDDYGSETSCSLVDSNGKAFFDVEVGYLESDTKYIYQKCLPKDSCYIFAIQDSSGDGICCSEGEGSYSIVYGGVEMASGGDFGSSTAHVINSEGCPVSPTEERETLMKLFTATGGKKWLDNLGWMDETGHHCHWYGVECTDDGYVSTIDLHNNGLYGTIPTEIGMLSFLNKLELRNNYLSDTIPTEMGNC